tara:strand:- start:366 stop:569 length:204 start_codon:yes stop_codon:yes gene_type:complete
VQHILEATQYSGQALLGEIVVITTKIIAPKIAAIKRKTKTTSFKCVMAGAQCARRSTPRNTASGHIT